MSEVDKCLGVKVEQGKEDRLVKEDFAEKVISEQEFDRCE